MKRDFLHITDFSTDEIQATLDLAATIKEHRKAGRDYLPLKGKTLAMIFAKPSARTRLSFETGITQLGGHAIYLSPNDIGLGKREAIKDIARVISRYDDIIMARLFDHNHLLELAKYAMVPVINGLTDLNHPCQVMADIFSVREKRQHLKDLKVAFIGDGNNVANSWINLAARLPFHFVLSSPPGYDPDWTILEMARRTGLSRIDVVRDPHEAVKDADVIYTDVWASMGQESEKEKRREDFRPYQVNSALVQQAKPNALVMHCLPAHRGEEITDEVIDGPRSIVFDEAENRMHVQKALMVKLLQ